MKRRVCIFEKYFCRTFFGIVLLIIADYLVVLSQEMRMKGIKNIHKVLYYKNACVLVIKRVVEVVSRFLL